MVLNEASAHNRGTCEVCWCDHVLCGQVDILVNNAGMVIGTASVQDNVMQVSALDDSTGHASQQQHPMSCHPTLLVCHSG
jgi:NAD(P)-dependent dehydrogenase (short-subunit alcohol dehydrogenase family)